MITFASARSSSPGSASTRGCVSSTSMSTSTARAPDAGEGAGDHLVDPDRQEADVERARLEPAHVEEVADERIEAIGLLVDREEELVPRLSVHSTSSWSRLVTDALMPESGVRRSCETAERIAVRRSPAAARSPASEASARSSSSASDEAISRENASRIRLSASDSTAPARRSRARGRRRARPRSPTGLSGTGSRPRGRASTRCPTGEDRERVSARMRRRLSRSTGTGAGPARPPSASASAFARAPSAARRAASETNVLTTAATARKTDSARRFSPSLDRERVHGWREVPVHEQKADHRGGERGPDAADGGDHDDQQQEEQEDAREPEIGAQVRQHPGQQREADRREEEPELTGAGAGRRGGASVTSSRARRRRRG